MASAAHSVAAVRFAEFTLNLQTGELQRNGQRTQLPPKAFELLAILLERPGDVVTREELRAKLWTADTFVEFDDSLNHAVRKLRAVLNDSAEQPRFIQTLPHHGYRFIAPVVPVDERQVENGERSAPARRQVFLRTPLVWVPAIFIALLTVVTAFDIAGLRSRVLGRPGPPGIESIAVLPLANLSGDPEQEYFAEGMTEELITDLGQIGDLRVISRTSVMRYKGTKKPLPEIARELNVDAIVEGTVRRSGDRVRITANLLYAPGDRHLWAAAYERDGRDILTLQNEVAHAIADQIRLRLPANEQGRATRAHPINPKAYELYLIGRYQGNRLSNEGLTKSLHYYEQAIAIDPKFAPAYAGMADSYLTLGIDGFAPGRRVFPKAKAAALKALQLDKSSAEAHASVGFALFNCEHDNEGAVRELETATKLNPSYVTARLWYSFTLAWLGRSEEAVRQMEQAARLDPLSARLNADLVYIFYLARQYDRAMAAGQVALQLEPNEAWINGFVGRVYMQKGMYKEALAAFQRRLALQPNFPKAEADLAIAYAALGDREEAIKILSRLERQAAREYVTPYPMARAYVALGRNEEALAWLRKGLEVDDGDMHQVKVDPTLDPLRSDPRFQEILRRMKLGF